MLIFKMNFFKLVKMLRLFDLFFSNVPMEFLNKLIIHNYFKIFAKKLEISMKPLIHKKNSKFLNNNLLKWINSYLVEIKIDLWNVIHLIIFSCVDVSVIRFFFVKSFTITMILSFMKLRMKMLHNGLTKSSMKSRLYNK